MNMITDDVVMRYSRPLVTARRGGLSTEASYAPTAAARSQTPEVLGGRLAFHQDKRGAATLFSQAGFRFCFAQATGVPSR